MKTLLIGAGAIGGTVAVLTKHAGYDVRLLCHSKETKDLIERDGFYLHGALGECHEVFTCYDSYEALGDETFDLIIIATKYQAMYDAAKKALPYLAEDGLVVGMQNGMLTESLAEIVGTKHAVGVMIGFGATRNAANDVTMTSLGEFYIGMLDGYHAPKLDELCEMFNKILPTQISADITREQYSKLIINSCINATAAITGEVLGKMVDDRRARTLYLAVAREGMYVAKAMNIDVPKYGKLLDYRLLMLMDNAPYNSICRFVVMIVSKLKYKDVKPSTLQSLEKGQKTEIDAFNGYFVEKGKELGVETPVNEKLVAMIHEIEDGKRTISPDNLEEFRGMLY